MYHCVPHVIFYIVEPLKLFIFVNYTSPKNYSLKKKLVPLISDLHINESMGYPI